MTIQELNNKYKEKVCPYCKGQCEKGIVVTAYENTIEVKCVDYEKNASKIEEIQQMK